MGRGRSFRAAVYCTQGFSSLGLSASNLAYLVYSSGAPDDLSEFGLDPGTICRLNRAMIVSSFMRW